MTFHSVNSRAPPVLHFHLQFHTLGAGSRARKRGQTDWLGLGDNRLTVLQHADAGTFPLCHDQSYITLLLRTNSCIIIVYVAETH